MLPVVARTVRTITLRSSASPVLCNQAERSSSNAINPRNNGNSLAIHDAFEYKRPVKPERKKTPLSSPRRSRIQAFKTAPASTARRWCFRVAAILLPLLLFGILELTLRAIGCGRPTAFLLKVNEGPRRMLTDNPWFGWRFFPPAVARAPRPLYLPAQKPPNTVRIFVFGESAAMGDPAPDYGFARQLQCLLQARHSEQRIEVINAAMTAINSHVIRQIARDCKPYEGDFWLVYAGNNEVIGPFGAGTAFGSQTPSLAIVRTSVALKATRVGQLLAQALRDKDEPKVWEGLEFFLRWRIPYDSPRLKRVYASFADNLQDITAFGRDSGATVLLSTIPVNMHDFPPLASVHRADLQPEQLADWESAFSAGRQAEADGRFSEALSYFERASKTDDGFAQLSFERACCERALKHTAAEAGFRRARDLDALRFRADSRINDLIRQTANASAIPLVDADAEFDRFADEDLFYDHVHLNFAGNYRVALLFAAELEKHWPGSQTNQSPWLSEVEIARRLAWTRFDEVRVGEQMRARLQQPPFNAQSNFRERDGHWKATLAARSDRPANCMSNYQTAISAAPDDWILRANFARLLEAAGDKAAAAAQWTEVTHLMPCLLEGWANLGRLAHDAGETERANRFFKEALNRNPDSVDARTEFGRLLATLGETKDAKREFDTALRLQPGFTAARVNLGLLLAREGNAAGAAAEYHEALRWETNNVEARINLANLLAGQGRTNEALVLYEQAVALRPENPVARYNLGHLLAANGNAAAAVTNFLAALQQGPDMEEIQFELGVALARLGRDAEAMGAFATAARLKPDSADARLNYGVALARNRRYREAIEEFRETLRLRPQDDRARRMLDQATRLAGPE
jgi:tetratricopeptide (TPR) repeat protein